MQARSIFVFLLALVVVQADSNEQFQHLPYALRNRFSNALTRRSLANEASEKSVPVSTTKPSTPSRNNMNYFVTHHIEDIESFFDETLEGPAEQINSNSLPVEEENTTPKSTKHHHHGHHGKQHGHNSTAGAKVHSTRKQKQISQKRTIKNSVEQANRDYVTAMVGKDVQLDCKIKDVKSADEQILWMRMPKGEILAFNTNRVSNDPRISAVCGSNAGSSCSLIISDTRESDTGFYACQTNDMKSKYVYLDIMVPPKLLTQYSMDRLDVIQGANASITCEFYGKPQPLVKWFKYHNNHQKEIEKFRGLKTIEIFIGQDSPNEYECVADNSIPPMISKKISLNIQYPPKIKFQNSRVFQKKGERVIFDCNVQANPDARVAWFKNKTRLSESSKYNIETIENKFYRLYVNNVADEDFGDYYCTATNAVGESTSKIELNELPSPVEEKPTESKVQPSLPIKQINLGNAYTSNNQKKLIKQTSTEEFELQTVDDTKSEDKGRNKVSEGYSINDNIAPNDLSAQASTKQAAVSGPVLIKAHPSSNLDQAIQSQLDSKNAMNLRNSYKIILASKNLAGSGGEDEPLKANFESATLDDKYKLSENAKKSNSTAKSRSNKPPNSRSNHHRNQSTAEDSTANKKSNVRKIGNSGSLRKSANGGHQHLNHIPPSSTSDPANIFRIQDEMEELIMIESGSCRTTSSVFVYLLFSILASLLASVLI